MHSESKSIAIQRDIFGYLGIKYILHPCIKIAFSILSQGTLATGPHTLKFT